MENLRNNPVIPFEDVENLIIKMVKDLISKTDKDMNGTNKRTNIINAAFNHGKFYGYMDILEELNIDKWVKLVEETENFRKEVLDETEKIYSL